MRRRTLHPGFGTRVVARGLRRRPRPPLVYQPLAYWRLYGLRKPNQYAAAEYAWVMGLEALRQNWCPARDRHWWRRPAARIERGRVYTLVVAAVHARRAKLHPVAPELVDAGAQLAERQSLMKAAV